MVYRPPVAAALLAMGLAITAADAGHALGGTMKNGSTTTLTTTTTTSECPGTSECFFQRNCSLCLRTVGALTGVATPADFKALSFADQVRFKVDFFSALENTTACSGLDVGVAAAAIAGSLFAGSCAGTLGITVGFCARFTFGCFADSQCRGCLRNVLRLPAREALASAACAPLLAGNVSQSIVSGLEGQCDPIFPTCSLRKMQCENSTRCRGCYAALLSKGPAAAIEQCPRQTPAASLLDSLINVCTGSDAIDYSYWSLRCASTAGCDECVRALWAASDTRGIATAWSGPSCANASQSPDATNVLINFLHSPTNVVGPCRETEIECVVTSEACALCLVGDAPPGLAPECPDILNNFGVTSACRACGASTTVDVVYRISIATAVVGGVSTLASLGVIAVIVANGRAKTSMQSRIVMGIMLANAVFSSSNSIPLALLHSEAANCGEPVLSFETIRFGRAWWFAGKYGLLGWEVLIVGASSWALMGGGRSHAAVEAAAHLACAALGATAFAVFYVRCGAINSGGYNETTLKAAKRGRYDHLGAMDDENDDGSRELSTASSRFDSGRTAYNELIQQQLLWWNGLLGVTIALWVGFRVAYARALRVWREVSAQVAKAEAEDEWGATRRSEWEAKRRVVAVQRAAYADVAKPLEPYVIVFVAFAVPAIVMTTTWCNDRSSVKANHGQHFTGEATSFSVGTCDSICELVISFRTLASVVVFVVTQTSVLSLGRVRRAAARGCSDLQPGFDLDGFNSTPQSVTPHRQNIYEDASETADEATGNTVLKTEAQWSLDGAEVTLGTKLGEGGFGSVWAGVWRGIAVAVKTIELTIDEEGDLLDPAEEEDFARECRALVQVNHPNLLKFFGHGKMSPGKWFIVTELMAGGSLEGLLADQSKPLPWSTRISIALQVASGCAHLHAIPLIHRDLKSPNVLLGDGNRVAVGDFGTSRQLHRRQERVMVSSFTGVRHVLQPSTANVDDPSIPVPVHNMDLSLLDPTGTMTKAAGTLLWMAPEVFRGSRDYTDKVDVYSFGIVLYELATRTTPWEELTATDEAAWFHELTTALQRGRRPTIPDSVASEQPQFVGIMAACWAGDPADRPSFNQVIPDLASCLRSAHNDVATHTV